MKRFIDFLMESEVIDGSEVVNHIKRIGTAGGLSSHLSNQIKNQKFVKKTLNIQDIFKHDLDVQDYVKNDKLRKKQGNPSEPIVIGTWDGKKLQVMDGYNRILYAVKNNKTTIEAYVSVE